MNEPKGFDEVFDYLLSQTFLSSVLVIAVASVLMYIIKQYLIKKVAYTSKNEQHKNTFIGMIFNVMQYMVIIVAAILIMHLHGVNIGSILAGLGIVATIVGLALQDTLKDIIAGINIYNNNFYKVGDMVMYNGEECDVKYFSARVTKFQSMATDSTYTVCNSQIRSIEKIKDSKSISVLFPFATDRKEIEKVFDNVIENVKGTKNLKNITYAGVREFTLQGVIHRLNYTCPAHKNTAVRGIIMTAIYDECKNAGITPLFK